jgi:hypothetical protein
MVASPPSQSIYPYTQGSLHGHMCQQSPREDLKLWTWLGGEATMAVSRVIVKWESSEEVDGRNYKRQNHTDFFGWFPFDNDSWNSHGRFAPKSVDIPVHSGIITWYDPWVYGYIDWLGGEATMAVSRVIVKWESSEEVDPREDLKLWTRSRSTLYLGFIDSRKKGKSLGQKYEIFLSETFSFLSRIYKT